MMIVCRNVIFFFVCVASIVTQYPGFSYQSIVQLGQAPVVHRLRTW